MREEALPIMRLMKDQRTPLPDPAGGTIPSPKDTDPSKLSENLASVKESKGSSLSRKFSTKKLFLGSAPKQPSPTHPPRSYTPQPREVRDDAGTHLEASAAAMVLGGPARVSREGGSSSSSGRGRCWMRRTGATQRGGGRRGGRRQQGSEVVVVVKVSSAAHRELRQTLSRRGVLRMWVCRRGGRPLCKAGTRNRQQALAMV